MSLWIFQFVVTVDIEWLSTVVVLCSFKRVFNVFIFDTVALFLMHFVPEYIGGSWARVSAFRSKKLATELTISRSLLWPRLLVMQTDCIAMECNGVQRDEMVPSNHDIGVHTAGLRHRTDTERCIHGAPRATWRPPYRSEPFTSSSSGKSRCSCTLLTRALPVGVNGRKMSPLTEYTKAIESWMKVEKISVQVDGCECRMADYWHVLGADCGPGHGNPSTPIDPLSVATVNGCWLGRLARLQMTGLSV